MVIISKTILNEFGRRHAGAAEALNEWYAAVEEADWKNLNEVKARFNRVDYVGDNRFVFNSSWKPLSARCPDFLFRANRLHQIYRPPRRIQPR